MPGTVPTTFPLSFFEYRGIFAEPIFGAWVRAEGALPKALYQSLRPWGLLLENISFNLQPRNAAEIKFSFNLPDQRLQVTVGLGDVVLTVTNPNWSEAETVVKIATSVIGAVKSSTDAQFETQLMTLAMHLIPRGRLGREIVHNFLNLPEDRMKIFGQPKNYGFSYYGSEAVWVADASALYPDGIFVRLARAFKPESPLADMASILYKDEEAILELLGLHDATKPNVQ